MAPEKRGSGVSGGYCPNFGWGDEKRTVPSGEQSGRGVGSKTHAGAQLKAVLCATSRVQNRTRRGGRPRPPAFRRQTAGPWKGAASAVPQPSRDSNARYGATIGDAEAIRAVAADGSSRSPTADTAELKAVAFYGRFRGIARAVLPPGGRGRPPLRVPSMNRTSVTQQRTWPLKPPVSRAVQGRWARKISS
jgi:hypothetical protein